MQIPDFDYPPTVRYFLTGEKVAPVQISLIATFPPILRILSELIDKVEIVPMHCYSNAQSIAQIGGTFPVHYVEGECVFDNMIVFHAWNYLPSFDLYFDATWEKLVPANLTVAYYPILSGELCSLKRQYPKPPGSLAFWTVWQEEVMSALSPNSPYWWQLLEEELAG